MEQQQKMIPISQLFRETWTLFKERFWTLLRIIIAGILIMLAFSAVAFLILATSQFFTGLVVILIILGIITFSIMGLALVISVLHSTGVKESYKLALRKFWSYLWLIALQQLVILGGFFLGIIPGIMFIVWFTFSAFVFIAEEKKGMNAFLRSKEYVQGYWWAVLWRSILLSLIFWVANFILRLPAAFFAKPVESIVSMAGSLLLILLSPFGVIYLYVMYRSLTQLKPQLAAAPVSLKRGFYIFSAIWGVIAPIILVVIFGVGIFFSIVNQEKYVPSSSSDLYKQKSQAESNLPLPEGLRYTPPTGWTRGVAPYKGMTTYDAPDGVPMQINIVVGTMSGIWTTRGEYLDFIAGDSILFKNSRVINGYSVEERISTEVGGTGQLLKSHVVIFFKGNNYFNFLYTGPAEFYDRFAAEFDQSLSSVELP